MYNPIKVLIGIIVFLALFTSPFWYNFAFGARGYTPDLKLPADAKRCVETKQYMRAYHMDMLNSWRDSVVRQGERVYVAADGKKYDMSLTRTCMGCHKTKTQFCDRCHTFSGVSNPVCWNCHVAPKESGI